MIYVPSYNTSNCIVIRDKDTIRVYDTTPTYNNNNYYTDYFINSHYIFNNGYQQFGSYTTLPTCVNHDLLTTNVFYRNDIDSILIVFLIFLLICFLFPYKLISRMLGRWLKW